MHEAEPDLTLSLAMQSGVDMSLFMVERFLPGVMAEQLELIQLALVDASRRLAAEGQTIEYLRSTLFPAQSKCFCLFRAGTADLVRRVNETAQLPFSRIEPVVELEAPGA